MKTLDHLSATGVTEPRGRNARERLSPMAFADLPALRESEWALLRQWLRSSAQERRWQSLLELAGPDRLALADALRERLLQAGAWRVHEVFRSGQWWPQRVRWCDLPAVQHAAGVSSQAERAQAKQALHGSLDALAHQHPWLAGAVQDLQRPGQQERIVRARSTLLQALADWQAAQLPWRCTHMGAEHWAQGTTRPLNAHDQRLLAQLLSRPDLPTELAQLCAHMQAHGGKAEQEGWL